jgi:hypothetical protein
MLASPLAIYCADIGSIPNHRFGWACTDAVGDRVERHRGAAEIDEGNRSWSAGAGAAALATGAVQVAWILQELRQRAPDAQPFLDWEAFTSAGRGLFL